MKLTVQVDKKVFIEYGTKGTPEDFEEFMKGYLEWLTQKVVDRLEEVMRRQLYNWHPLSKSYLEWKKKMKLDPRIWLASHQTREAITYWWVPLASAWMIGFHPRTLHRKYKRGGIDLGKKTKARLLDIVRWLEHGTTKMPPRPLFGPVLNEFKSKSVQLKLYQQYIKEIKAA